jgi:gliding motility-associated-like protein/uncharacterized repeat protein (TIGR01451 family)
MANIGRQRILIFFTMLVFRAAAFSQGTAVGTAVQSVEIPQGTSITIQATSVNGISFQWFKNGVQIDGAVQATLIVTEEGEYNVLAFNQVTCSSLMSDPLKVTIKQTVTPTSKADMVIVKRSETRTTTIHDAYEYEIKVTNRGPDAANDVVVTDVFPEGLVLKDITMNMLGRFDYNASKRTLTWNIDKLENAESSELRFRTESVNPGVVQNTASVTATEADPDASNNQSTDKKLITDITVPNIFTPNGDGVNDRFEIKNLSLYKENELSIINRWGNSVYEKKDYMNTWDGFGLDEGTYFYVLKVKNATGSWKVFKGYVTLLRTQTQ